MKKNICTPRNNWIEQCNKDGFFFHSLDGKYWIENYEFEFTEKQINELKTASKELHFMCLDLVEDIVKKGDYEKYKIQSLYWESIEKSWKNKELDLYSRFDFSYDGISSPKMLEYNADTPTTIIESSLVQKRWFEDKYANSGYQQFNDIYDLLIKRWELFKEKKEDNFTIHFTADNRSEEDWCNVEILRLTAEAAGINTVYIDLQDIGWDYNINKLVDLENNIINNLFKLYPWEFLVQEELYPLIKEQNLEIIEPMWKMLLSNKAILPILWEKHPNHPNLLPSFFYENQIKNLNINYVKKPLLSREGANVIIYDDKNKNIIESANGVYGAEGYIYQERKDLICFDNRYSMIGVWLVGEEPAGLAIREDSSLITKDTSWFIPHIFK